MTQNQQNPQENPGESSALIGGGAAIGAGVSALRRISNAKQINS